jgi:hypothetical protein
MCLKPNQVVPRLRRDSTGRVTVRSHQTRNLSSVRVVAPHIIICRCASFIKFVAPQQDNNHYMSLPFVEEGETSEDPTKYIHNIIMTTEEAVNEVLNRQRFIR